MRPVDEADPPGTDLLHPFHEVVGVLVHDGLERPYRAGAERGEDLPGDLAVSYGVLLPDDAAEVGTTVLEVRLFEELQPLVRRRIDIDKGLGREEDELVGGDPDHVAVLVQHFLNGPWVAPRKPIGRCQLVLLGVEMMCLDGLPVTGIPNVGHGGDPRAWEFGERVKV